MAGKPSPLEVLLRKVQNKEIRVEDLKPRTRLSLLSLIRGHRQGNISAEGVRKPSPVDNTTGRRRNGLDQTIRVTPSNRHSPQD